MASSAVPREDMNAPSRKSSCCDRSRFGYLGPPAFLQSVSLFSARCTSDVRFAILSQPLQQRSQFLQTFVNVSRQQSSTRRRARSKIVACNNHDENLKGSNGVRITRRQAVQLLNGVLGVITATLLFKLREQYRLISPQGVLSALGFGRIPSRSSVPPAVAAEESARFRDALSYIENIDKTSPVNCPDFPRGSDWLNSRPLSLAKELKGKVVLLDFFTYCCINCQHILPKLRQLEIKYGEDGSGGVVVVGVHSAKFTAERETRNIAAAVERYDVRHPVLNDERTELWNAIGVSSWPTLVLIGPKGNLLAMWSGERQEEDIDVIISAALQYYSGDIDHSPLPPAPQRNSALRRIADSPLRYPGKIALSSDGNLLFVSDTGNNRILKIDAKTLVVMSMYGNGDPGLRDSPDPAMASFHSPQGIVEHKGLLFVADTESHAVRSIDLQTGAVETIGGNDEQGFDYSGGKIGTNQMLSSPWDVEVHDGVLFVAMAGTHQIWKLDLPRGESRLRPLQPWRVFSGSGRELEKNSSIGRSAGWAQPSHLSASSDGILYVADSESSSVRSVDLEGSNHPTKTLAGGDGLIPENLFAFGDKEGKGARARFQHPLAVCYDRARDVVYVADSYNHRIKTVDRTGAAQVFCGNGSPGFRDGPAKDAMLWEPGGLALSPDETRLYISDTNNSAIRVVDIDSKKVSTIELDARQIGASSSATQAPLIPNRRRAVRTTCDDVSPQGMINFSISLPENSHFTPGTTSRYQVNVREGEEGSTSSTGVVVLTSGAMELIDRSAFFNVDLSKASTQVDRFASLEVEALTYYCTEEDDVCRTESDIFDLKLSKLAAKEQRVERNIRRRQAGSTSAQLRA